MAGVAALFASPALPFPSTPSTSCSCRFRPAVACAPRHQPGRRLLRRFDEVEGVSKKRRGIGGGGGGSQASSRRDRGLAVDFKEPQVADLEDLEEDKFLNAVVKVYCTHIAPDYGLPWQKQRQHASTGSAFMIGDGKLLTNAHCVEHDTQVKVKRRGDDKKYVAKDRRTGALIGTGHHHRDSRGFYTLDHLSLPPSTPSIVLPSSSALALASTATFP